MNKIKIFQRAISFTLVALLLVGCSRVRVEPPATVPVGSDMHQDIAHAVDELMIPYVEDGTFSGSVLIAQGENILVSKGYGMANLEHDVPNTSQTKFRLGSITKQFTAMAILLLQEQGKLSVHDPVCDRIPDCPEAWQSITIHHLLTHSSGIRNFTDFPDYQEKMTLESTVEDTLKRFRDQPLAFTPGSKFRYSNSGYVVLGYIIEQASGTSYAEYLREHIFEPLGMKNTGYDYNHLVLKDRAAGYSRAPASERRAGTMHRNAGYIDMSIPHAAGGLYSTVEDLYLWDQVLSTESLVSQRSLDSMFTPHIAGYGYGWRIRESSNGKIFSHGGGISGFTTMILRLVDDDAVVVVLSNIEDAPLDEIAPGLVRILFEENHRYN